MLDEKNSGEGAKDEGIAKTLFPVDKNDGEGAKYKEIAKTQFPEDKNDVGTEKVGNDTSQEKEENSTEKEGMDVGDMGDKVSGEEKEKSGVEDSNDIVVDNSLAEYGEDIYCAYGDKCNVDPSQQLIVTRYSCKEKNNLFEQNF